MLAARLRRSLMLLKVLREAHLPRYLSEWDHKLNYRKVTDAERAAAAVKGADGKRLMYNQPRQAANA